MSPLEEAIAELGRCSWTGINIVTGSTDWWPVGDKNFEEGKANNPIWPLYERLVRVACGVKNEWNKTSKEAKDVLFSASMNLKRQKDEYEQSIKKTTQPQKEEHE